MVSGNVLPPCCPRRAVWECLENEITKKVVDALQSLSKEYVRWDGELTGFGVRVRPSGKKSFVAVYRIGGRNTPLRRVTIGSVAERSKQIRPGVKLSRSCGKQSLAMTELAERAKLRAELTLSQVCDLYLEEGCETKKLSTMATDRGRIVRHIKPLLGQKRIGEITRADMERFMRDVANGKTAARRTDQGARAGDR